MIEKEKVISLCESLLKCKSVTPEDNGCLDIIAQYLSDIGFEVSLLTFTSSDQKNSIKNLYAKFGNSDTKVLGFLGHSDVVPAGDAWDVDPFGAISKDGYLYGRGICDMKGGIAAFCSAVAEFIAQKKHLLDENNTSIVVMITGDEEVGSFQGIRSLIEWTKTHGTMPHDCLVGEPSSDKKIGDRVYIGHRGSLNICVKSKGKQGHVAYPDRYINSLSNLCQYIAQMQKYEWKHNDKRFPRTHMEPTMLFTGNFATNIVPEESSANINIRYGADYVSKDLVKIFEEEAEKIPGISLEISYDNGAPYCCDNEKLKTFITKAICDVMGSQNKPAFSCGGGTSDGRYLVEYCNVIEFGMQDATIHQRNERAKVDDLVNLSKIYCAFLERYFKN